MTDDICSINDLKCRKVNIIYVMINNHRSIFMSFNFNKKIIFTLYFQLIHKRDPILYFKILFETKHWHLKKVDTKNSSYHCSRISFEDSYFWRDILIKYSSIKAGGQSALPHRYSHRRNRECKNSGQKWVGKLLANSEKFIDDSRWMRHDP